MMHLFSRRHRPRVLCLLMGVALAMLSGCGPDAEEQGLARDVNRLERDRARLKSELATYRAIEKGEKQNKPMALVTLTTADLEKALRGGFPVQFPASKLSNQVSGTITISRLSKASIKNGVVRFQLAGKGRSIKLRTAVPPGYQNMARELISGLQSGLTMDVEGQVYVDRGQLLFSGRTVRAKLKKHAKKSYHDLIVNGVNQQLFRKPHAVKFSRMRVAKRKMSLRGILTETNRFVLVFK